MYSSMYIRGAILVASTVVVDSKADKERIQDQHDQPKLAELVGQNKI